MKNKNKILKNKMNDIVNELRVVNSIFLLII